jgi:hypothetical protein
MQKWEYLVLMYGADGWYGNGVKVQGAPTAPAWEILKGRGAEGWEMIGADAGVMYFKRAKVA